MDQSLFHYAKLSSVDLGLFRSPGPGFGNLLFPISRALIGAQKFGGKFIYPTVRQIKVGPYLRNEPDKRTYGNLLRPRTALEFQDWMASHTVKRINEEDFSGQSQGRIVYEGLKNQFYDLIDEQQYIKDFLEKNSRQQPTDNFQYDIALHVRLGDFSPTDTPGGGQSVRLPIEWYRTAHAFAQNKLGSIHPKTVLFSDAVSAELLETLQIKNIQIDNSANALQSMLLMTKARALIASRSTFSLWAAYLGQNYSFWPKHFDLHRFISPQSLDFDFV